MRASILILYILAVGFNQAFARTAFPVRPCDGNEAEQVEEAKEMLISMLDYVSDELEKDNFETKTTYAMMNWFGAVSAEDAKGFGNELVGYFSTINAFLEGYEYLCPLSSEIEYEKGLMAYVYPDHDKTLVYLAPRFFDAEDQGYDSKAGILLHELLHHHLHGGSNVDSDETYGVEACLELAKSEIDEARGNADSIMLFVEQLHFDLELSQ